MDGHHHARRGRSATPRRTSSRQRGREDRWPTCISCSRRWSRRARPTSTSPPARRRSSASTASSCRSRLPPLSPVDTKQLCYSILTDAQKHKFEEEQRARPLLRREGPLALPRQHLHAARRGRRRVPHHPLQDPDLRGARACRRSSTELAKKPRGLVLVTGPDRLGQVDHARVDHRQDQHRAARAHHHDRGSDRVPAPAQELPREPARGRRRHAVASRRRSSTSCARTRTSCWSARCATSRPSRRR